MNYNFNYSNYSKRIHKKTKLSFTFLTLVIIFLLSLTIFLKPKDESEQTLYFIQLNSYSTYQQANTQANKIKTCGVAGYIYYDNQYYVFANFYTNKTQAEKVLNNIKDEYKNAKIFEFSIKIFKNNEKLSKNQCKITKNITNFINSLIFDLSNLSIKYDKQEIKFNELNVKLKNYFSTFLNFSNEFSSMFKSNSQYNVCKKYLKNIETDLKLLSNYNETELTENLKYLSIDIAINYSSFLSCFWFDFISSTNCQIARQIKNTANNFVKISFFSFTAISAPIKLKPHPTNAKPQVDLKSTSLFFMWIIIAIIAIGKNATKLTPCACNCSYDKIMVKIGIVSVPPPIPIPPIIPPNAPKKIPKTIINSYLNNIPIPPANIKKIKIPFIALLFNLFKSFAPIIPPKTMPTITGHPWPKSIELLTK